MISGHPSGNDLCVHFQVLVLLRDPERQSRVFPVVEELLPLLLINRNGPLQEVSEQVHC